MPWDDIPDSNVFPSGTYHVVGVELKEVISKNGKLMYSFDVQIVEHPATAMYKNMHFFENFVIGSDDDLEATVPGTWQTSFGASRMKQMITKAQIAEHADMDKICASFPGAQFVMGIIEYKEPEKDRDGQPNAYAGQARNKSGQFYKIGEKEPKLDPVKPAVGQPPVQAPVVPVAPTAPPAVTPGPPVQPVAPVAPTAPPAAPPPVQPAAPAAPVQPAPPAAPVAPTTPQPAQAAGQMLLCNVCGTQVPAVEFTAHLNDCLAKQQQA
jgi:hypothetical protein